MSIDHVQNFLPGMAPRARRAGSLRAVLGQRLASFGQALWQALEDHGRRRSDRELRALAERWRDSNPKLARELKAYLNGGSSY